MRCRDQWIRDMSFTGRLGSGRPQQTSRREDHQIVSTSNCFINRHPSTAEWNHVIFSEESRINLSRDDNHVHEWRPRDECFNPVFALQHQTAPTAGVRVLGAITYNTRLPLVFIRGTITTQQYVHDIL
ncbi:transposable element Tcb2 transposase [Trichonephila clavipes]|nr:transposable element Tcb2 transposase [Trichonephila clavipes]